MGILAIIAVIFGGLTINNENAEVKVTDLEGLKAALVSTYEEVKARDTFMSFDLND